MKTYFLFIDTETTGIPKRWSLPYSKKDNWPSAVQVAWVIYDENAQEVKRENFYIFNEDLKISSKSLKIHGITKEFLVENGQERTLVLEKLSTDIKEFHPLITGHFTEFDIHTLSADFYRANLENPFLQSHFYCTMLKSKEYVVNPEADYFKLPQLYEFLFNEKMEHLHNAMIDAEITAKCFFEIRKRGEVSETDFQNIHQKIESGLKFLTHKMK